MNRINQELNATDQFHYYMQKHGKSQADVWVNLETTLYFNSSDLLKSIKNCTDNTKANCVIHEKSRVVFQYNSKTMHVLHRIKTENRNDVRNHINKVSKKELNPEKSLIEFYLFDMQEVSVFSIRIHHSLSDAKGLLYLLEDIITEYLGLPKLDPGIQNPATMDQLNYLALFRALYATVRQTISPRKPVNGSGTAIDYATVRKARFQDYLERLSQFESKCMAITIPIDRRAPGDRQLTNHLHHKYIDTMTHSEAWHSQVIERKKEKNIRKGRFDVSAEVLSRLPAPTKNALYCSLKLRNTVMLSHVRCNDIERLLQGSFRNLWMVPPHNNETLVSVLCIKTETTETISFRHNETLDEIDNHQLNEIRNAIEYGSVKAVLSPLRQTV